MLENTSKNILWERACPHFINPLLRYGNHFESLSARSLRRSLNTPEKQVGAPSALVIWLMAVRLCKHRYFMSHRMLLCGDSQSAGRRFESDRLHSMSRRGYAKRLIVCTGFRMQ